MSADLEPLVKKYFDLACKTLNPDETPDGIEQTRAYVLMVEFLEKINEYSHFELLYALHSASILLAVGLDEKFNPPKDKTLEDQIAMLSELDEEHLLRVWFGIGQLEPHERSQAFTDAMVAEFKRRGMAIVPETGI
jgi:hypothetical protein